MRKPARLIFIGLGLASLLILIAVARDEEPPDPPDTVCSIGSARACEVPQRPCASAGSRDKNPSNRRIEPIDGLSFRASADAPLPYGFNDPAVLEEVLSPAQDVALNEHAGSSLIRVVLDWGAVEATPNSFDFGPIDELYCATEGTNVKLLFTLTGVPPWAIGEDGSPCSEAPCVQPPAADQLPALRRFAELAAIRYPEAAAFEAWNEPNFVRFWPEPDPERYTELLRTIYTGVKNGVPEMPVLGGSLAGSEADNDRGSLSMLGFLSSMLEAGAGRHMDGLAIHAYPIARAGTEDDLSARLIPEAGRMAAAAVAERSVPLWITELGVTSAYGSFSPRRTEEEQAADLASIYRRLEESPLIEAITWHLLVDVPGVESGFNWYELEDGTATPKPVACEFRAISGLEGCEPLDLG